MKPRPPACYAAVPFDDAGKPINIARDQTTYDFYLHWLADYLYRPSPQMPPSAILTLEQATPRILGPETEIAIWIWEYPCEDYPPDDLQPRHADILHCRVLAGILSRVPAHADRYELLNRFYCELNTDAHR